MTIDPRKLSALMLAGLVLVSGCGPKRPPVVKAPPPPANASTSGRDSSTSVPRETIDPGSGLQPFVDNNPTVGDGITNDERGPLADVHFGYDQAGLDDAARTTLDGHAGWLKQHAQTKVVIQGHCDERGTAEYNLALGEQRARAAKEYLASLGIAAERMTTVSFGKEKPIDPASNEAAWAKNRRAHFAVSN